jgi:hypothetical protein
MLLTAAIRIAVNDQAESAARVDEANFLTHGRSIHLGAAREDENSSPLGRALMQGYILSARKGINRGRMFLS